MIDYDMNLLEMGLDKRIYLCLSTEGIITFNDLNNKDWSDIISIPGIGKIGFIKIDKFIKSILKNNIYDNNQKILDNIDTIMDSYINGFENLRADINHLRTTVLELSRIIENLPKSGNDAILNKLAIAILDKIEK